MKKGYCENCDMLVDYVVKEEEDTFEVRGKKFDYKKCVAYCKTCNGEISVNDILDENLRRIDDVYRKQEKIISVMEIGEILKKYKIGKKPLSKLLGWGEVTITRYINGDMPTKPYSEELFKLLKDSCYMEELLERNKNNITQKAYLCVKGELENLKNNENRTDIDSEIELISEYIIYKGNEITPLALQKILYYAQGFFKAFFGDYLYKDDCEAWVHGPVYTKIYDKYKNFGSSNIILNINYDIGDMLDDDKKELLDVVIKYFGYYNGKALEKMTHFEAPWVEARRGKKLEEKCNSIITKNNIEKYFEKVKERYDMLNLLEIRKYSEEHFFRVISL
ncbi:MAG: DUF4065 domain-containing protein [Clostridia bacterium]|nr:DUF4065 domain-containing protein [Clostridia bacterium]